MFILDVPFFDVHFITNAYIQRAKVNLKIIQNYSLLFLSIERSLFAAHSCQWSQCLENHDTHIEMVSSLNKSNFYTLTKFIAENFRGLLSIVFSHESIDFSSYIDVHLTSHIFLKTSDTSMYFESQHCQHWSMP